MSWAMTTIKDLQQNISCIWKDPLPFFWPKSGRIESGDEGLTINKPALAVIILALDDSSPSPDKAPHLQLADVWCDVDNDVDDEELSNIYKTPTAPADIQSAHL